MGMTGTTGVLFMFTTWAWRWPWVARFMGRPIVHGQSLGGMIEIRLRKRWCCSVGRAHRLRRAPDVLDASIRSLARSKRGSSTLEALTRDEKTQGTKVSYVFKLDQPRVAGGKSGAGERANQRIGRAIQHQGNCHRSLGRDAPGHAADRRRVRGDRVRPRWATARISPQPNLRAALMANPAWLNLRPPTSRTTRGITNPGGSALDPSHTASGHGI